MPPKRELREARSLPFAFYIYIYYLVGVKRNVSLLEIYIYMFKEIKQKQNRGLNQMEGYSVDFVPWDVRLEGKSSPFFFC